MQFYSMRDLRTSTKSVFDSLDRGEVVGIVGESGSGKSVTAMTLLGLTRGPNATIEGHARLADGTDLIQAGEEQMRRVRGNRVSMIFQDPMTALNPVHRVGDQDLRGTGERHGDHHPLAHPSRKLVRVGVDPLARTGYPDLVE